MPQFQNPTVLFMKFWVKYSYFLIIKFSNPRIYGDTLKRGYKGSYRSLVSLQTGLSRPNIENEPLLILLKWILSLWIIVPPHHPDTSISHQMYLVLAFLSLILRLNSNNLVQTHSDEASSLTLINSLSFPTPSPSVSDVTIAIFKLNDYCLNIRKMPA